MKMKFWTLNLFDFDSKVAIKVLTIFGITIWSICMNGTERNKPKRLSVLKKALLLVLIPPTTNFKQNMIEIMQNI